MDITLLDNIDTQFKVHNKGAISPGFVIPFLVDGRMVHVQSIVWRGVTVTGGSISLGSIFYVGETDNIKEEGPWRPQQNFFKLLKSCLDVIHSPAVIYIRSYQLFEYDISEAQLVEMCLVTGRRRIFAGKSPRASTQRSAICYIHTVAHSSNGFDGAIQSALDPREPFVKIPTSIFLRYCQHAQSHSIRSYQSTSFSFNGDADLDLDDICVAVDEINENIPDVPTIASLVKRIKDATADHDFLFSLDDFITEQGY